MTLMIHPLWGYVFGFVAILALTGIGGLWLIGTAINWRERRAAIRPRRLPDAAWYAKHRSPFA